MPLRLRGKVQRRRAMAQARTVLRHRTLPMRLLQPHRLRHRKGSNRRGRPWQHRSRRRLRNHQPLLQRQRLACAHQHQRSCQPSQRCHRHCPRVLFRHLKTLKQSNWITAAPEVYRRATAGAMTVPVNDSMPKKRPSRSSLSRHQMLSRRRARLWQRLLLRRRRPRPHSVRRHRLAGS